METNRPTSSPLTCNAAATAGAIAGNENSAIVASVCAANVATNGHIGIMRGLGGKRALPWPDLIRPSQRRGVLQQEHMQSARAVRAEFQRLLDVGRARRTGD